MYCPGRRWFLPGKNADWRVTFCHPPIALWDLFFASFDLVCDAFIRCLAVELEHEFTLFKRAERVLKLRSFCRGSSENIGYLSAALGDGLKIDLHGTLIGYLFKP